MKPQKTASYFLLAITTGPGEGDSWVCMTFMHQPNVLEQFLAELKSLHPDLVTPPLDMSFFERRQCHHKTIETEVIDGFRWPGCPTTDQFFSLFHSFFCFVFWKFWQNIGLVPSGNSASTSAGTIVNLTYNKCSVRFCLMTFMHINVSVSRTPSGSSLLSVSQRELISSFTIA